MDLNVDNSLFNRPDFRPEQKMDGSNRGCHRHASAFHGSIEYELRENSSSSRAALHQGLQDKKASYCGL